MNPERKHLLIKIAILTGVAIMLFVWLSPILYRPQFLSDLKSTFYPPDVSIMSEPGNKTHVRVGEQEAFISGNEWSSHPLIQEARRRVESRGMHWYEPQSSFDWPRILKLWFLPLLLLYLFLFKWSDSGNEYVTGPRI